MYMYIYTCSFVISTYHFCSLCTLSFHCPRGASDMSGPISVLDLGGMSSIDTLVTKLDGNDFFSSFQICYYFYTLGCGSFSLNKFHSFHKCMVQISISLICSPNSTNFVLSYCYITGRHFTSSFSNFHKYICTFVSTSSPSNNGLPLRLYSTVFTLTSSHFAFLSLPSCMCYELNVHVQYSY